MAKYGVPHRATNHDQSLSLHAFNAPYIVGSTAAAAAEADANAHAFLAGPRAGGCGRVAAVD